MSTARRHQDGGQSPPALTALKGLHLPTLAGLSAPLMSGRISVLVSTVSLLVLVSRSAGSILIPTSLALADSLFLHEYWYDAATEYERWLHQHPLDSGRSLIEQRLVQAHARSGEIPRAERLLSRLGLAPAPATRFALATGYLELAETTAARAQLASLLGSSDLEPPLRDQGLRVLGWLEVDQGNYQQAAGHFLAAGDSVLAHAVELKTRLPRRSPELAFWLSTFVPGAGELYAGNLRIGLLSLAMNGAIVAGTVHSFRHRQYMDAAILLSFLFGRFYFGARANARDFAQDFNRRSQERATRELRQGFHDLR